MSNAKSDFSLLKLNFYLPIVHVFNNLIFLSPITVILFNSY